LTEDTPYQLNCLRCGKEHGARSTALTCAICNGELSVVWDLERLKGTFSRSDHYAGLGVWAYARLLPILRPSESKVTLGEGGTPILRAATLGPRLGIDHLYLKDDTRNPTASFKDRGISVAVSKAKEFGEKEVVTASTGNVGASVAAYCAKAGLTSHVFLPESTPKSKVVQTLAYGAKVHMVRGNTTDQAGMAAQDAARRFGWHLIRSNPKGNPYPMEGTKTIAFEISEQLGWRAPDFVITGVGSGTNLAGNWKGFTEFNRLGLLGGLPSMVGVQAEGSMPFVDAVKRNLSESEVKPWPNAKTIASGLADAYPNACLQALGAVRDSNGTAVSVTDRDLVQAQLDLARFEGVFAEPSGAAPIAGLKKLLEEGTIDKDQVVVCEITGSGLKQLSEISEVLQYDDTRLGRRD